MVLFKGPTKRKRSFLGRFLDAEGLSQEELIKWSGVSRNTLSRCCSNKDYTPHIRTAQAIVRALKRRGYDVEMSDFFRI